MNRFLRVHASLLKLAGALLVFGSWTLTNLLSAQAAQRIADISSLQRLHRDLALRAALFSSIRSIALMQQTQIFGRLLETSSQAKTATDAAPQWHSWTLSGGLLMAAGSFEREFEARWQHVIGELESVRGARLGRDSLERELASYKTERDAAQWNALIQAYREFWTTLTAKEHHIVLTALRGIRQERRSGSLSALVDFANGPADSVKAIVESIDQIRGGPMRFASLQNTRVAETHNVDLKADMRMREMLNRLVRRAEAGSSRARRVAGLLETSAVVLFLLGSGVALLAQGAELRSST